MPLQTEYYANENARRDSELEAVNAVIPIFEEDLICVSDYTEARAEGDFETNPTSAREIHDYERDRTEYEEAGGYTHD